MTPIRILAVALPLAMTGFSQNETPAQTTTEKRSETTEKRTETQSSPTVSSKSYKGTLVDASCVAAANPTSSTTTSTSTERTKEMKKQIETQAGQAQERSNSADRTSRTAKTNEPDTSLTTTESANATERAATRAERSATSPEGRETTTKESTSESARSSVSSADRSAPDGMKESSCPVTTGTTSFGLMLKDGHFVRLDDSGNAIQSFRTSGKVTKAQSNGKPIQVKVKGSIEGDTLHVDSIK